MENKYLVIENEGLLEVGALSLMGASSKRGDSSKIGMFGSGNKYALAYLLRNNHEVKIFSGAKEIILETKPESFRGKKFEVIYIDGEKTSITTEMGLDWDLWQAVRELYSNGIDEGMKKFEVTDSDHGSLMDENTTKILITMNSDLGNFMTNINDYLAIDKEVLHENEYGKIYKKHGGKACIYRKGIKVFETDSNSVYDYDLNSIQINESRLVKYNWEIYSAIWEILYKCDDVDIARNILYSMNSDDKLLENRLDEGLLSCGDMSDAWTEAIENKTVCPRNMGGYLKKEDRPKTFLLPDKLYTKLISKTGSKAEPKAFTTSARGNVYEEVAELSELQKQMAKEIRSFLKECKFDIPYEVEVVEFSDKDIMGSVAGDKILIDIMAFDKGKEYVLMVIIEEYIHIKHDVADETRAFQMAAIEELIRYMKEINAYNL